MKLIVGLGNPEPEYSWTRHNVGKEVVNLFAESLDLKWETKKKHNAQIIKHENYILAKPLVFMNESGNVVGGLARYYDISLENLLIAYDELDIFVGEYKLSNQKSSKIHNGIISIKNILKDENFWHLRVGVRDESILGSVQKTGIDPAKYVLSKFSKTDKKKIVNEAQDFILTDIKEWLSKK